MWITVSEVTATNSSKLNSKYVTNNHVGRETSLLIIGRNYVRRNYFFRPSEHLPLFHYNISPLCSYNSSESSLKKKRLRATLKMSLYPFPQIKRPARRRDNRILRSREITIQLSTYSPNQTSKPKEVLVFSAEYLQIRFFNFNGIANIFLRVVIVEEKKIHELSILIIQKYCGVQLIC